jgi:hypothetical protein
MSSITSKDLKINAVLAELLAYLSIDLDPEQCIEILSKKAHLTGSLAEKTSNLSEKIAVGASNLIAEAPSRFLAIYDKLHAVKAVELEPFITILNAFHSHPRSSSMSPPRVTSAWSSGNLPLNTPSSTRMDATTLKVHSLTQNTPSLNSQKIDLRKDETPALTSRILNDTTLIETPQTPLNTKGTNRIMQASKAKVPSKLRNVTSPFKVKASAYHVLLN